MTRESLVDHLQRGHTPTDDAILTVEVILARLAIGKAVIAIRLDVTAADTVQQRIDFLL